MGGYSTGPGSVTLVDASSTFVDNADPTKKVALEISGITTATTRTLTIPDVSATLLAVAALTANGTVRTDSAGLPSMNVAPQAHAWFHNIGIARATTTNAGDSVKITSASGTALLATNSAWIDLPGTTAGTVTRFSITADVTILLTGAHWGAGTLGDLTGALLRVLAVNDNGTLRWGVALLGGRNTILTTDSSATTTSVTAPEHVLMKTAAVGSATNRCREIGFVRADFDDTGGAAEDLWAIQTGVDDCTIGESPDGLWQPWNPTYAGFSANPTTNTARWTQVGRMIHLLLARQNLGTSNATTFTIAAPVKGARVSSVGGLFSSVDNGADVTLAGMVQTAVASTTLSLFKDPSGTAWTAANGKGASLTAVYECGPVASFI